MVDVDPTCNLLSSKRVLKLKRNEHGDVSRFRRVTSRFTILIRRAVCSISYWSHS